MTSPCFCGEPAGHADTYHATDMPNPTGSFSHTTARKERK